MYNLSLFFYKEINYYKLTIPIITLSKYNIQFIPIIIIDRIYIKKFPGLIQICPWIALLKSRFVKKIQMKIALFAVYLTLVTYL